MKLRYHLSRNFGDALNPYIFNHFLPQFFDNQSDVEFVGIGSVLGFKGVQQAKRKIVFSSGFAYGTRPQIDNSYDIRCVRGPKTTQTLGIKPELAITDGAALISKMPISKPQGSKIKASFMPHWESEMKYDWSNICAQADVQYISPIAPIESTLHAILNSELILAEAMHGAIIADALRIPWIPIVAYGGINQFKWLDWTSSLELPYRPNRIKSLYGNTNFTRRVIKKKLNYPFTKASLSVPLSIYEKGQNLFVQQKVVRRLKKLTLERPYLSNETLLDYKTSQLLEILHKIHCDYK